MEERRFINITEEKLSREIALDEYREREATKAQNDDYARNRKARRRAAAIARGK